LVGTDYLNHLFEFILERLRHYYLEKGFAQDEFNAVYQLKPSRPLDFDRRLQAVSNFRKVAECSDLIIANKRIRNILNRTETLPQQKVAPEHFCEPAEQVLFDQASELSDQVSELAKASEHSEILRLLAVLRDPIDVFFDQVMVMDENPQLRNNRVALVAFVHSLFLKVADLSQLQPTSKVGESAKAQDAPANAS